MAFDFTTAKAMTKAYSVLISDATDAELQSALELHAVPRIKMYFLAASDANGQSIFYTVLGDMADLTKAAEAELLVDAVMESSIIKDAVRRIAAAYACAWIISSRFSILDSQYKQANRFEDQATADLERLCKSQLAQTAIEAAAETVSLTAGLTATLYLATDIDQSTIDTTTKTAEDYDGALLPYVGAPEAGKIVGSINGISFEATLNSGDTPVTAAQKLVAAFEAIPLISRPNVTLATSEVPVKSDTRLVEYTDPLTAEPLSDNFKYIRKMAKISILARDYDNIMDVAVLSVSLLSRDQANPTQFKSGVRGLLYGSSATSLGLTNYGPHAIAVDLHTGKTTALSTTTTQNTTLPVSDSLFFITAAPTTFDGTLTYRVSSGDVQTVPIPAGSDALAVCEALAKDLADKSRTQRVLGAVRPSTIITVSGTPISAPGLELVAFGVENQVSKIVLHVLSVPEGVTFGVVPSTLSTQANFDARSKSVVIATTLSKIQGQGSDASPGLTPSTEVKHVQHKPSPGLQSILDKLRKPSV